MNSVFINSTPRGGFYLPFSNEVEMQEFVEKYAAQIFGLKVIASTRPGRQGLYKIDVLAVDSTNTPFIIECKWNEVRPSAIRQLVRYRELLAADRSVFRNRLLEKNCKGTGKTRRPVLIAIGYTYHPSALSEAQREGVVCLTYSYHGVTPYRYRQATPTSRVIVPRFHGTVSVQHVPEIPPLPHARVCKKRYTTRRLANLTAEKRRTFNKIHYALCKLNDVTVMYGGKCLVSYQVPKDVLVEAMIEHDHVKWRLDKRRKWTEGADANTMVKMCKSRYARLRKNR